MIVFSSISISTISPPTASLAGMVTDYLIVHPDGITTHFITYHMQNVPRITLNRVIKGKRGQGEKAWVSIMVITVFFLGSLLGALASENILGIATKGSFIPAFSIFSFALTGLVLMHFKLCEQFCYNYQKETQVIEKVRHTMNANGANARTANPTVKDIITMVMMATDEEDEDVDEEDEENNMIEENDMENNINEDKSDEESNLNESYKENNNEKV